MRILPKYCKKPHFWQGNSIQLNTEIKYALIRVMRKPVVQCRETFSSLASTNTTLLKFATHRDFLPTGQRTWQDQQDYQILSMLFVVNTQELW
jgi:hypothetical protein